MKIQYHLKKEIRKFGRSIQLLLIVVCMLSFTACIENTEAELKIKVFKIGKADAILLSTESGNVLIDTGEKNDSGEIIKKISLQGIDKLDYLILTHYDKDHVGGAANIIDSIPIDEIIEPGYEKNSDKFEEFEEAAEQAGIKRTLPKSDVTFNLDSVQYTIMVPQKEMYENENDYSLVVRTEYNGYTALFAGDALEERTEELMGEVKMESDILKVPHHGSFEENSEEFFKAVNPQYALITCSKKNPADKETLHCLQNLGTQVFLTMDGDIEISFSEKGIEVIQ